MANDDPSRAYVERVLHDGQRYTQELLQKNETLGTMVATLEAENRHLLTQIESIQAEAERTNREHADLRARLAEIQSESSRFAERFVEVERQNSNLASLYVASYQIHGSVDRDQVLVVIQEILANLVGSEETAIFEVEADGSLVLVSHNSLAPEPWRRIARGEGLIGRAVETGETWIVSDSDRPSGRESALTACIPLKLEGRVTGAIAIFRLLPQKKALEAVDRELFDLLATHAAMAMYCTGLHRRLAAGAS